MDMGKFHGVMAATTPTGCFSTIMRLLRSTVSSTSPVTRRHSDANQSTLPALQQQQQQQVRISKAAHESDGSHKQHLLHSPTSKGMGQHGFWSCIDDCGSNCGQIEITPSHS
jgi:hypothetical protein